MLQLISLLALCAEGENHFIESMCQSVIDLQEVCAVLLSNDVALLDKTAYLQFLHCVYLSSANLSAEVHYHL